MLNVSVVITNYNYAEYVAEAIESVLAQSFAVYEIIVIDDCSTDNSREVLSRYEKNDSVKILLLEANI
ncbi:glycosyltransferase family 2 protein [Candidatus Omnitrophota bacterium]